MAKKFKILVADDHPLFRAGVINFLNQRDYEIAGEASNGNEAFNMTAELKPDILILDMDMPGLNGIQVIEKIKSEKLSVKIIFLTMYKDEKLFNRVMDHGISGYLLKESAVIEIHDCIDAVMKDDYFISPVMSAFLINRMKKKSELENERKGIAQLTEMERKVLQLIAHSKTSKQIGNELFISPRTVEKHRENICQKLEIKGSNNLVKFAIENKHSL